MRSTLQAVALSAFFAPFFLSLSAQAQTAKPIVTGRQLIQDFQGEPGVPVVSQKGEWVLRMQRAEGYLAGVADAYDGISWCDKGTIKRNELESYVIFDLKKLDKTALDQPAAKLVERSLSRLSPCKK